MTPPSAPRSHPPLASLPLAGSAVLLLAATAVSQAPPAAPPTTEPTPTQASQDPTPPAGATSTSQQPTDHGKRVVVTARKWDEPAQNVPQSLSAFTADDILDAGIDSVREASLFTPNTVVTQFTSRRLSFPYVRGVGSGQGDPAVTTFIDGVPQLEVSSTNLPLFGVERIEFLRGPNGALYGRNSIGGTIKIETARPTNRTQLRASTTLGEFNRQDYRIEVMTPVVEDELYVSIGALHEQRDGYTDNDATGNDVDYRNSWFGRGQVLWTPDEMNEVRLTVYGEDADDGGFALSDVDGLRANPRRINQDFEGRIDRSLVATSLTWTRTDARTEFRSISSVQDWSVDESADFDFSILDGVRRFTREEQTYLTQEFSIGSADDNLIELDEDTTLRWIVGVIGFYSDSDDSAANEFRPGGAGIVFPPTQVGTDQSVGDFEDFGIGAYAQATLTFDERLEVTGALRYDYESRDAIINRTFAAGGFVAPLASSDVDQSFDEFSPRASVSFKATEDVMVYGLAARGFKAGGFNLTAPTGLEAFGPETSWTFEGGVKTDWLDDSLRVNASYFYIDWEDMQLSQFNATTGGFVTNAGESTSQGVEVEVRAQPVEGLELYGTLGVLDTEFDRFTDQFGINAAGNDLPFAPDTSGNFGAQYTFSVQEQTQAYLRADFLHVGSFFFDASNLGQERYDLVNFRAGLYGRDTWRVEAWIENALDEDFLPVALQINPADPTQFVGENGAPRVFGVTVSATF